MAEFTDPEIFNFAMQVVAKLDGYSEDIETVVDEAGLPFSYHDAPKAFFDHIDAKVWKCRECDIWTPVCDLKDETCIGCRPSQRQEEADMTAQAKPIAVSVTYAATIYAYRVQVWAEQSADGGPIEEYTGGNSRHDSAAFVDPKSPSAETLTTMQAYAKGTAEEMAVVNGVALAQVGYDTDLETYLTEAYGPREAADA